VILPALANGKSSATDATVTMFQRKFAQQKPN